MSPNGIYEAIPMLHVTDVQASIDFYAQFGLECDSRFGPEGAPYWAAMSCNGTRRLMFATASGPVDASVQAVLFFLYTEDVRAMREHLLGCGLLNMGAYHGGTVEESRKGLCFDITHPHYMPAGELRVHDPDGYVLLIAQMG